MEKHKVEPGEETASESTGDRVTAEAILSPRLLRFGNQHALREAVWLMSEMLKRADTKTSSPLFLQDREGRLDGELSIWAMLNVLANDINPEITKFLPAAELGEIFRRQFGRSISEISQHDLPVLKEISELHELLQTAVKEKLSVLPVCDVDGRLKGLVRSVDLLKGIGLSIGFNPEKELPKT